MAQITVKAAPGVRVPLEGSPREYITDAEGVLVDRTPYYLRRLAEGDLLTLSDAPVSEAEALPAAQEKVVVDTPVKPVAKAKTPPQENAQ